jgi:1-acyl-sn-glycerol-3-phosphate acyltransferase
MAGSQALARLSRFATESALPFARSGVEALQAAVEKLKVGWAGPDFDDRLRRAAGALAAGGVDPFGMSAAWFKTISPVVSFFHRAYFRAQVFDIERLPRGRVLLVANHSGQIPIDGLLLSAALLLDAEPPRLLRSMVDKWTQTVPFVSTFYSRTGQVVGVPENARRLLDLGEAILVFPEGMAGIAKDFTRRYQLTDFGTGFMRLALETDTPIVPIAVIGGEEQYVSLGSSAFLSKALGIPAVPILPQLLIPGGQFPLPTRYRIYFGEPMIFHGDPDDDPLVEETVAQVRSKIQSMVDRGVKERKSIFF